MHHNPTRLLYNVARLAESFFLPRGYSKVDTTEGGFKPEVAPLVSSTFGLLAREGMGGGTNVHKGNCHARGVRILRHRQKGRQCSVKSHTDTRAHVLSLRERVRRTMQSDRSTLRGKVSCAVEGRGAAGDTHTHPSHKSNLSAHERSCAARRKGPGRPAKDGEVYEDVCEKSSRSHSVLNSSRTLYVVAVIPYFS